MAAWGRALWVVPALERPADSTGRKTGSLPGKAGLVSAEYRYRVFETLSLGAFLSAGRVSDTPGGLFAFPYHAGAGLAAALHPADLYAPSVRLEFGVFGRETVFQITGSASL
ncbi:MAG: hypothetical protein R3B54_08245 [Bdellovibrionota bacterium]